MTHRMLAAPPWKTAVPSWAMFWSLKAQVLGQHMPVSSRLATNAPKICENIPWGTFFHGKPCHSTRQIGMAAGLKWPPDTRWRADDDAGESYANGKSPANLEVDLCRSHDVETLHSTLRYPGT